MRVHPLLLIVATSLSLFLGAIGHATDTPSVPTVPVRNHQDASVMVQTENGLGSGVVFVNGEHNFVWTDAHVVAECQRVRAVYDPQTQQSKIEITYDDVWVVQAEVQNGRKVGETRKLARIVRYCDEQDIALLHLYQTGWKRVGVKFATKTPVVGEALWHVGAMRGTVGMGSVSEGVLAALGRLRNMGSHSETHRPIIYDQVSLEFHKGSSGGGVFLKRTGECVGLVTEFLGSGEHGYTDGAGCITPARRLQSFAREAKCSWAFNQTIKFTESDLVPVTIGVVTMPRPVLPPLPADAPSLEEILDKFQ